MSLADLADLRRQKTVRSNVSAKADAADNAEKDSYHIVETKLFMFIQQICEETNPRAHAQHFNKTSVEVSNL